MTAEEKGLALLLALTGAGVGLAALGSSRVTRGKNMLLYGGVGLVSGVVAVRAMSSSPATVVADASTAPVLSFSGS